MAVAIAGATGNLGRFIAAACLSTPYKGSFSSVKVLTRDPTSAAARELAAAGAEVVRAPFDGPSTDVSDLAALLVDVRLLIDAQSGGHDNKDALLAAAAQAGVKAYIPSEFGIDHRSLEFPNKVWDEKRRREKVARAVEGLQVVSIYPGLFLEDSFGPRFGFDTEEQAYHCIGSPDTLTSYTSKVDIGLSVASVASIIARGTIVPSHIHLSGTTASFNSAAAVFSKAGTTPEAEAQAAAKHEQKGLVGKLVDDVIPSRNKPGHQDISVHTEDLAGYKATALREHAASADPAPFLRFLMGEGKIDFSETNDNDLVNPSGTAWQWTTLEDYAKSVHGRPWCSDAPRDDRTPLKQAQDKLHLIDTRHSHITGDISQSIEQTQPFVRGPTGLP